ncbi:MAG: hypothetical protein ACLP36_08455 [Acidimicrobiales bacterium]
MAVRDVAFGIGMPEGRARPEIVNFLELVQLLRFVKTPGGVLLFGVGPAFGARLHSYFDCAL